MPFYFYEVVGPHLKRVRSVSLGGENIIYSGWVRHGRLMNAGWHMDSDEIISMAQPGATHKTYRIIIDLVPKAPHHIIFLELLDIYGFTYGSNGQPEWTPLMFKMRDVFNYQDPAMIPAEKDSRKKTFLPIKEDRFIFEFVYLQKNWNPGRVGGWNAPLLHPESLAYFKKFLCP